MKRTNKLHYRSIKQAVYYTIRGIILLPIRLVLWPFKLLRRSVFYRKPKLNKTVLTTIFNKLKGINERIKDTSEWLTILEKHIERKTIKFEDRDKVLSNRINNQLSLIRDIEERIDKLESTDAPIDLGEFNFINTDDETDELLQVEAEILGSSVAKEEYDWHREQKAKDKQIQGKMRADEAEYDRLSEPDKDNGVW